MSAHKRMNLLPSCLVLAMLLSTSLSQPLRACMTPPDCPDWDPYCVTTTALALHTASGLAPAGRTTVTVLSPRRATIEVAAYVTPSMSATYACSIAFPLVEGIERIDRVSLVSAETERPLAHYRWVKSQASVGEFARLADTEGGMKSADVEWQGFFTEVEGGSVGGILHFFRFDVTLGEGATVDQLVTGLRQHGMLANGSANSDGSLNFAHYYLRRLGDGDIQVVYPGTASGSQVERPDRRN